MPAFSAGYFHVINPKQALSYKVKKAARNHSGQALTFIIRALTYSYIKPFNP